MKTFSIHPLLFLHLQPEFLGPDGIRLVEIMRTPQGGEFFKGMSNINLIGTFDPTTASDEEVRKVYETTAGVLLGTYHAVSTQH